jgi:predicted phage-related endonuclease
MTIYECEQKSDEWFSLRKGKMTASHAQAIGNNGKGLDTYIIGLMAEYYSSGEKEMFSNFHTDRGNELEPQARSIYELTTGQTVQEVGFIEYDEFTGCSPDGLVGEDGGLEIKCLNDVAHFKHLLNGADEIDSGYIWQIQMNLLITGRKWWDYVAYNPNFQQSTFVHRFTPDEEMHKKLLTGITEGAKKIKDIKSKF